MDLLSRCYLAEEVYRIQDGDSYVFYAPTKGILFKTNDRYAELIDDFFKEKNRMEINKLDDVFLQELADLGFFSINDPADHKCCADDFYIEKALFPTHVIFLISDRCNFACKYCYASAEYISCKKIDEKMVFDAIRFVINNAKSQGVNECALSFHGGGEPALEFPLIKKCLALAHQYKEEIGYSNLKITSMMVSNGYLSDEQIHWIVENLDCIQISFDGPDYIQNDQRPLQNGEATFVRVMQTIEQLFSQGMSNVLIKSTISRKYTTEMPIIAKFLCENTPLDRFHFGAVLNYGRAAQSAYCEPNPAVFVSSLLEAQKVAEKYGKTIISSVAQATYPDVRYDFCGVTGPNFALTVDGDITACYEVLTRNDRRSERYFYGKYDRDKQAFLFEDEKIARLINMKASRLKKCELCFAKWQCAGDCQSRWYDSETGAEMESESDFRCIVNRNLLLDKLRKSLENSLT